MSYLVSGISPVSSQYGPPVNDLPGGPGTVNAQSKATPGQPEAFKTAATPKTPAVYGIEKSVAAPKVATPAPAVPGDTVKLSVTDHVRTLRRQGEDSPQIATTLHLSTKEVQDDLYVVTTFPQLLSKAAQEEASQPVAVQSAGAAATTGAPTITAPKA